MRASRYLISTTREFPREAEYISHKLMLKAGLIKKVAAGIYSFFPLGYRVLAKISSIVREEMDNFGAQELLLPFMQPARLWKKSGRWTEYGDELIRFQDRKRTEFILGPTHEEIITELVKKEITSYKQLPLTLYQIQIKFRDEQRPRGGVIRAREFLMKDAYSFCQDKRALELNYEEMKKVYEKIFSRCSLNYKIVEASPGAMGGEKSEEFIALSDSGEDRLVECKKCGYLAKMEMAESLETEEREKEELKEIKEVYTPQVRSIEELCKFLNISPAKTIKTILYETEKEPVAVLVRGDHQINEEKIKKLMKVTRVNIIEENLVKEMTGIEAGFLGPVEFDKFKLIVDNAIIRGRNFVTGGNKKDIHLVNVNPERDFKPDIVGDIRFPLANDKCPFCKNRIEIKRGIELAHLFQLGQRYSQRLGAFFLNKKGKKETLEMGCYGIGISRLPAVIIEQNHDKKGIIWPKKIAPFQVAIVSTNQETLKIAERVYHKLNEAGIETLWDDRELRAGVKFQDIDLIGIPFKLIIGNTFLKERKIEIKERREERIKKVSVEEVVQKMEELIKDAK